MSLTDVHKKKTTVRWIDATVGERLAVWTALRGRTTKGNAQRRFRRALEAIELHDSIVDDLTELQMLELATGRINLDGSEADIKSQLKRHRELRRSLKAMKAEPTRVRLTMENLDLFNELLNTEDDLDGHLADEMGSFVDEVLTAKTVTDDDTQSRYLYEDGVQPAQAEVHKD